ncbi:hypothetical protein AIOL_002168 [Candidatus Rhodobacter oscarellae]|uniref:Peptidase S8/S53 domain-containing protein n=1 Tax=Candidatus Rhodobacter oscarellae TaxID=1675527 RepID=A0A0J9E3D4_9RHOB|nr:S8 family serine peptidase [Candidatus Rhodobacter lobularis]KMW57207.1 hypothetical protein AIOL_002168 [Candidatus Rhodobacter lobularis]
MTQNGALRPLHPVKNDLTDFRLGLSPDDGQWWSALLTLEEAARGISIDEFVQSLPPGLMEHVIVPVAYTLGDRSVRHPRNFLTVIAHQSALHELNRANAFPNVVDVDLGTHVDEEHLDFNAEPIDTTFNFVAVPPDSVVMVVIDDGIGIAHNLLRDKRTSTRVLQADFFAVKPDPEAKNATYGRRLDKAQIDALMEEYHINGILDEVGFYKATGQIDFASKTFDAVSLNRSHGTHVAAMAAGYPMGKIDTDDLTKQGVKNRPIVCAALPAAVTQDVTGQSLLPSLALALQSISNLTRRLVLGDTKDLAPVILNFSYGNTSGPHDGTDGTSELLEFYGTIAQDQKTWMALPVGNDNLSQGHAVVPLGKSKKPKTLTMVMLPDDRTATQVEFWMPFGLDEERRSRISIAVSSPDGETTELTAIGAANSKWICDSNGCAIGRLSFKFKPAPTERGMFLLCLNPTHSLSSDAALAPSGRWQITMKTKQKGKKLAGEIHAWIRRDESLPGYAPHGRQSFFVGPDYKRFGEYGLPITTDPNLDASLIRRSGTISGFACGETPIVIAGMNHKASQPADYSATALAPVPQNGGHAPMPRNPDVATISDESYVLRGTISAGTYSGSFARMNGTSVAAPRVARFAGDHIAEAHVPARTFLYKYLGAPKHVSPRIGAGVLNVQVPWYTGE